MAPISPVARATFVSSWPLRQGDWATRVAFRAIRQVIWPHSTSQPKRPPPFFGCNRAQPTLPPAQARARPLHFSGQQRVAPIVLDDRDGAWSPHVPWAPGQPAKAVSSLRDELDGAIRAIGALQQPACHWALEAGPGPSEAPAKQGPGPREVLNTPTTRISSTPATPVGSCLPRFLGAAEVNGIHLTRRSANDRRHKRVN
jgi:hypothetical protein